MYNFLFLLVTSFCFGQSYNCLEEGIGEIISNKVELKSMKYKQLNYEREKKYIVDSKVKISLSNTSSFIELIGKKRKMSFSQMTKNGKNIFLNLEDVFYLKYKKEILYIFEFKTLYQGIGINTYNVIFSKNKGEILFKQWNSSGNGISNSFGISKNKLFVLNQIRDSINYYELKNKIIKYQHNYSSLIKIDSLGKVCVQNGYKF
ncbi:hypothetical protein [Flavobacterium aquidurense]|uniref:Uncharacterized protein n=1 Tax=Flavobacterium aquidurense TaxID=362413 RepID=A0A0Q0S9L9_9FLAO|nr:hypothetical protein [Flavobacterium aquidurense]KQB40455.1 hypothetical protein RC62_345 [Flavobacterium aquidurense]